MGLLAYQATDGNPCSLICQYYDCGNCPHYQRLKTVPADFDSRMFQSIATHGGICALMLQVSAASKIQHRILPFAIHLLTAKDALQLQEVGDIWEELRLHYPANDGRVDVGKLTEDAKKKMRELGLYAEP